MKILFVGDVMLGRLVNEVLKEAWPEYVWGDTLPLFGKADFRICNVECVIANSGRPWTGTLKVFHFRSDAKNVAVLQRAHIDAVSLANNHAFDFGHEALFEMIKLLRKNSIAYAGAGRESAEACAVTTVHPLNKKVGLIAFTDNEPDWKAKDDAPGVCYVPIDPQDDRAQKLFGLITHAKSTHDIVVVSAHWGPNWGYRPPAHHQPFARHLIDAGADIVFGHSCHVTQGIEFYKERLILYGAGDFIDDYAVDQEERNDESFVFLVDVREGGGVEHVQLHPTVISHCRAQLAQGQRAKEIALRMASLCAEFGTKGVWNAEGKSLTVQPK